MSPQGVGLETLTEDKNEDGSSSFWVETIFLLLYLRNSH